MGGRSMVRALGTSSWLAFRHGSCKPSAAKQARPRVMVGWWLRGYQVRLNGRELNGNAVALSWICQRGLNTGGPAAPYPYPSRARSALFRMELEPAYGRHRCFSLLNKEKRAACKCKRPKSREETPKEGSDSLATAPLYV
jgi:hypothetical protein